jgi:hypothetical protein
MGDDGHGYYNVDIPAISISKKYYNIIIIWW